MKRYYIVFKGRVQGVGFRWTAIRIASNLGLSGWVRNLDNGDVDCEVQGSPELVSKFIRELRNAGGWIRIEDYSVRQIALQKDTGKFTTKGYY